VEDPGDRGEPGGDEHDARRACRTRRTASLCAFIIWEFQLVFEKIVNPAVNLQY
jgi:hypothetical protein